MRSALDRLACWCIRMLTSLFLVMGAAYFQPRLQLPYRFHQARARAIVLRYGRPLEQIEVDLGPEGDPKGLTSIKLDPLLKRSKFLVVQLGLPLGMLIEVEDDGAGSAAGNWYQKTRVVITDALPGYSAHGTVQKGDLLRAMTAYRVVKAQAEGGFSAWKQVTSGTPVGEPVLRRLVYKCEGATYEQVREAIASHNEGNRIATLVIERPLDEALDAAASE